MWDRKDLKEYAKDFLSKYYWKAFLVCLIVTIFSNMGVNGGSNRSNSGVNYGIRIGPDNLVFDFFAERFGMRSVFYVSIGTALIIIIILAVLFITIGAVLEVGKSRFFLEGFKGNVKIDNLFSGFNSDKYFSIVKTQFLRQIYTLLWTLLFIIPGIIKSYEYSMVPYILAEDPDLPSSEVIDRSRDLTDGHKWEMFVLDISFWGWYLLGSLFLGIGKIFVTPYRNATIARLYNVLSIDEGGLFED